MAIASTGIAPNFLTTESPSPSAPFSSRTGAAGLLEAEIVTADGVVRVVNEWLNPDLFWAIKGGGGGTFGVVTRFTLRTRELPEFFGAVSTAIRAASDEAYRALIGEAMSFYRAHLFNAHWGEKIYFRSDNTLDIGMLFQGLTRQQAEDAWAPFFGWVRARKEYSFTRQPLILAVPAQRFWDAQYMNEQVPGLVLGDDREGAPRYHAFWKDNQYEAGQLLHAYKSAWLPAALLEPHRQRALADAIFASSRQWGSEFHFNKGLAGASVEEIASQHGHQSAGSRCVRAGDHRQRRAACVPGYAWTAAGSGTCG
jgi:hypothetical protein